jgi:1-acyl-sn-glycerol-3-phosphate acyltransferase
MMLKLAVKREHPKHREVRWLAEDLIFHFPFLGSFSNRVGAVRACQENAERLLSQDALVAVFPEGMKGIGKLYRDRYKLQRFGRGGFIKLCLRTRTLILPCAIVGGEETNPMLMRIEYLTRAFGIPYLPVTPTFPLLGPVGLFPAPTKWRIAIGEPMALEGYGPEAAEDEILIGRLSERVRATIQSMLDRTLGERKSVWFG